MAVKIRLARVGKIHAPVYRIVAIDSRKKRDGESLEILGSYNPITSEVIQFREDRIQDWVSKGAILSDAVKKIKKMYKDNKAVTA